MNMPINIGNQFLHIQCNGVSESLELLNKLEAKLKEVNSLIYKLSHTEVSVSFRGGDSSLQQEDDASANKHLSEE